MYNSRCYQDHVHNIVTFQRCTMIITRYKYLFVVVLLTTVDQYQIGVMLHEDSSIRLSQHRLSGRKLKILTEDFKCCCNVLH